MPSFFDKPVKKQIELAIDNGDSKLVQILLGPQYCQLSQYWMEHCILSYKLVAMRKVTHCTLPLSIIEKQSELLTKAKNALTEPDDKKRKRTLEEENVKIGKELVKELFTTIYSQVRDYKDAVLQLNKQNLYLFPSPNEVKKAIESKNDKQDSRIDNSPTRDCYNGQSTAMRNKSDFSVNPYGYDGSLTPGIDSVLQLDLKNECNAIIDDLSKMLQSRLWKGTNLGTKFFHYLDIFIDRLNNENLDATANFMPQSGMRNAMRNCLAILRPFSQILLTLGDVVNNPDKESSRDRMKKEIARIDEELTHLTKQINTDDRNLSFALNRLNESIKKMQDNKLIDKSFVKGMYEMLLKKYLKNVKEDSLLYNDVKNFGLDCVEKKIFKQHNDVKFEYLSEFVERAVKMSSPNIDVINVLFVNVAYSESLNQLLSESKHEKIRDFIDKSKNRIMVDANNMLFDFQFHDFPQAAFCSLGGDFEKNSDRKIMLTRTGDYIYQEIMQRCKTFKEYIEENWELKNPEERKHVDRKMTELFDKVQCAISRSDEGVMHDYIKEVKERLKHEKNKDVLALYNEITHNTWRDWFFSWFWKVNKEWEKSGGTYKLQTFLNVTSKKIESLEKEQPVKPLEREKDAITVGLNPHESYHVGQAIGGGDCFFHSVLQGLKQVMPERDFGVKLLRNMCHEYANSYENNQWFKEAVVKDANQEAKDDDIWNAYVMGIRYTKNKIEQLKDDGSLLYNSLVSDKYGITLVVPIWGRPEIEGRAICNVLSKKYKTDIALHVLERHDIEENGAKKEAWVSQIIDSNGSRPSDDVDYEKNDVIHIVNSGNGHFVPLLRKPSPSLSQVNLENKTSQKMVA